MSGASLSHMPVMPEMLQGSQQHKTSHHAATASIQRFSNSIGSFLGFSVLQCICYSVLSMHDLTALMSHWLCWPPTSASFPPSFLSASSPELR